MYRVPLREMRFVLDELLGEPALRAIHPDYSSDLMASVLEEAARFSEEVLAPLNRSGDEQGSRWTAEGVHMPAGFPQAYARYIEGGWAQLTISPDSGGQGMPLALGLAVEEAMFGANMAFTLAPSLARGAVEALEVCGTEEQKRMLLPKLVSGEWTGTMNLTEAQAGSDLGLIRTRAVPEGDHYRIFGQKIFITYGDHDLAENILHLVLARIEGAPAGVRGISMFLVPKLMPEPDGSPGVPNDLRCLSIEHKLGIHASPTCVMAYGEKEGAIGYLAGEAHNGLAYMFVMMNSARLSVGVQGLSQAERAFQQASAWARSRLQGKVPGNEKVPVPIIEHPDVKRMLLSMRSQVDAMRALAAVAALELDRGRELPDAEARAAALARGELLIPIVKGWCTETGIEVASTGIQVHGGMGFIEETGAAQTLRDVRIAAIYEGTTAIQSNDLVGRKLGRDRGAALRSFVRDLLSELDALKAPGNPERAIKNAAIESLTLLRDASEALLQAHAQAPARALAVSVPYLQLCGIVFGGCLLARSAAIAQARLAGADGEREFYQGKLRSAQFYAEHILPRALGLARIVKSGAGSVLETDAALI